MKRSILLLLCIFFLVIPVKAHPGKTDDSGGHWDYSTGDYHYHHGYPPHDHYDMDGDGDIDCPYDFDDQTGRNSGGNSDGSSSSYYSSDRYPSYTPPVSSASGTSEKNTGTATQTFKSGLTSETNNSSTPSEEENDLQEILFILIVGLSVALFRLMLTYYSQKDEIIYLKGQHERDIKKIESEHKNAIYVLKKENERNALLVQNDYERKIMLLKKQRDNAASEAALTIEKHHAAEKEHKELLELISKEKEELSSIRSDIMFKREALSNISSQADEKTAEVASLSKQISIEQKKIEHARLLCVRFRQAPLDVSFAPNGMPVYWKPNSRKPYGDYTVYYTPKSKIYHTDWMCAADNSLRRHIFEVIGIARPCKRCATGFFPFDTVPDWYARNLGDLEPEDYSADDQLNFDSVSISAPE